MNRQASATIVFSNPRMPAAILQQNDASSVCELAELLIKHVSGSSLSGDTISLIIANISFMCQLEMRSVEHLLRAAQYCLKAGANEAAAIYYRMVLEACERPSPSGDADKYLIDSAVGLVEAQSLSMPLGQQRDTLSKAQASARKINDQVGLCKIDLLLGEIAKSAGDYDAATDLFEEAWHFAGLLNDDDIRKKAALVTADFLFWQGKVAEAVARYEDAIGDLEQFSVG